MNDDFSRTRAHDASTKRMLITGASGFVGRNCVTRFVEDGYEVVTVSRGALDPMPHVVEHVALDLFDRSAVARVIERIRPTHLLHLAWPTPASGTTGTWEENLPWISASLDMVRHFHASGGQRLVVAGTCAEYTLNSGICSEDDTPTRPNGAYGTCKAALQLLVDRYCADAKLSYAWPRFFFVYGPHEKTNRLIPTVIESILRGEQAQCSHGMQVRDYVFIDDVAEALLQLSNSRAGGAFNVASGETVEVRQIARLIATEMSWPDGVRFGAAPEGALNNPVIAADITRLTQATNWKPRHTLRDGLRKTIHWWTEQHRQPTTMRT